MNNQLKKNNKMEAEKKLKDLPTVPKKGKIYEMYGKQYGIETMKKNLKILIENYKELSKMHVGSRDVPQPVWIEWLKVFGFPHNYKPEPELLEIKTIFDKE